MWQLYAWVAIDIAREREAEALGRRFAPERPSALRRLLSRAVRVVTDAAGSISGTTTTAARRLDGAG